MDARRMKNNALVVIDLRNALWDEDNGCIDYECSAYISAWEFEHWGSQRWTEYPKESA